MCIDSGSKEINSNPVDVMGIITIYIGICE